jgi:hypothetical protein
MFTAPKKYKGKSYKYVIYKLHPTYINQKYIIQRKLCDQWSSKCLKWKNYKNGKASTLSSTSTKIKFVK